MSRTYNEDQLYDLTNRELRNICIDMNIVGMTRAVKNDLVDAILENNGSYEDSNNQANSMPIIAGEVIITGVRANGHVATTARASCGASSINSNQIVGHKIVDVMAFFEEVLNVGDSSSPIVNGSNVDGDYIIKSGDNIEFIRAAGHKG